MNFLSRVGMFVLSAQLLWVGGCSSGDDDVAEGSDNAQVSTDGGEGEGEGEGVEDAGLGIGSACTCEGAGCGQLGIPIPNGGDILGCDDVPTGLPGAELVCLRSYEGNMATNTYFAGGYCALMASKCEGDPMVCGKATFGDFDAMTACPEGTVMITSSRDVEVDLGVGKLSAVIDNKICVAPCEAPSECRQGELDDVLGEATQYTCNEESGLGYCYDPRNLAEGEHSVQAF